MYCYVGVFKNRGTPKSSILIGFSIINHPFWGTPIFGNTHVSFGEGYPKILSCGSSNKSWGNLPWPKSAIYACISVSRSASNMFHVSISTFSSFQRTFPSYLEKQWKNSIHVQQLYTASCPTVVYCELVEHKDYSNWTNLNFKKRWSPNQLPSSSVELLTVKSDWNKQPTLTRYHFCSWEARLVFMK